MNDEGKLRELQNAAFECQIAKGNLIIAITAIRLWAIRQARCQPRKWYL